MDDMEAIAMVNAASFAYIQAVQAGKSRPDRRAFAHTAASSASVKYTLAMYEKATSYED